MISTHTNLKVGALDGAKATTQVSHDFNSYCRFGEHFLACRNTGLCSIGGSSGTPETVNSSFKTFSMKLGHDAGKRLHFIYLCIETEGTIIVTPTVDGVVCPSVTFSPAGSGRQYMRKPVGRGSRGCYWEFTIENVDGCWFSIDEVQVLPGYLPLWQG